MTFQIKNLARISLRLLVIILILLGINFIFKKWLCWHFEKKITPAETSMVKGSFGGNEYDTTCCISELGRNTT